MGEHKQPINVSRKQRWDSQRGLDLGHHRYIWRSSEKGTFKYPESAYGVLKKRRTYKDMRKFFKKNRIAPGLPPLRGRLRGEVMLNLMGLDE